jgi:L-arabinose isomerase
MSFDGLEVWFLTGSQSLYGEETLRQVADQSRTIAEALEASTDVPVRVVWKPVVTTSDAIRRVCLDATADDACIGVIAWMHTFSPAKMWIAGLDALRTPLLHLHTQAGASLPWSTIDMDFMNLNQAAHGDREFGHVQTRMRIARKTIAGHVSDPTVTARVGTWMRAAVGWQTSRTLTLARFGDNMRNVAVTEADKVEAQIRFGVEVNTYGVNDLVERVDAVADERLDVLVEEYEQLYAVAPELRRGGDRHESLRYAARIEAGLRDFLVDGGFGAFTTNFEDLGGLRQLPGLAVQRLMADGYGFGGEGDWKTSALLRILKDDGQRPRRRHVVHGGLHLPPRPRPAAGARRPHARGLPDPDDRPAVVRGPPARHRRTGRTRCGWSSPPTRDRASSSACSTSATASAWSPTPSTSCRRTSRCRCCRWRTPCGSRGPACRPARRPGCSPAVRTTPS